MLSCKRICIFWGLMDLLYLIDFSYIKISSGRIPFYSDIVLFNQMYAAYGESLLALAAFALSLLLSASVFLSAILFFIQ
ncbi:hypothetical protein CIG19_13850 [Enterobacterales bacterium CwR94]|nr:hypothetical protein CIG19_13850 [Enterobacterales bacterium CwR94]